MNEGTADEAAYSATVRRVPGRVGRPVFEAVLWQNIRLAASPHWDEREAGLTAIMAAFDGAMRTRLARPVPIDVSVAAEAERARAHAVHGDGADVTAQRRLLLREGTR